MAHLRLFATSSASVDLSKQRLNAIEIITNIANEIITNIANVFKHPSLAMGKNIFDYMRVNNNSSISADHIIYLNENYEIVSKALLMVNQDFRSYFGEDLPDKLLEDLKKFIVRKIMGEFTSTSVEDDNYAINILKELIESFESKIDLSNKSELFLLLLFKERIHCIDKTNLLKANAFLKLNLSHKEYESGTSIIQTYLALTAGVNTKFGV